MTSSEFAAFRDSVEDTFISLYVIDVGSLSKEQRQQHQAALSEVYLALTTLENAVFAEITDRAMAKLDQISGSTLALQKQLAGLKKAAETLRLVSAVLDVFTSIAKIFK